MFRRNFLFFLCILTVDKLAQSNLFADDIPEMIEPSLLTEAFRKVTDSIAILIQTSIANNL